jgi:hypothetical protein
MTSIIQPENDNVDPEVGSAAITTSDPVPASGIVLGAATDQVPLLEEHTVDRSLLDLTVNTTLRDKVFKIILLVCFLDILGPVVLSTGEAGLVGKSTGRFIVKMDVAS